MSLGTHFLGRGVFSDPTPNPSGEGPLGHSFWKVTLGLLSIPRSELCCAHVEKDPEHLQR